MYRWILLAAFSAIFFGLGDFIVVASENQKMDVVTLYITYTILIGLLNLIYLVLFRQWSIGAIKNFTTNQWLIVLGLCFFYFFAYMMHFIAIQEATNPGYANALIMFHLVLLTTLSWYFLNKPLNKLAGLGVAFMFFGGYFVTMYS
jgi:drug/metabolite transporter (DMT)-like permease